MVDLHYSQAAVQPAVLRRDGHDHLRLGDESEEPVPALAGLGGDELPLVLGQLIVLLEDLHLHPRGDHPEDGRDLDGECEVVRAPPRATRL